MSLKSFSRGNAGFGRSAANGTNFIGRGGNTGGGRYRAPLDDSKKGIAANHGSRRIPVDRSGPK
ncbi:hypothetical protein N7537_009156 [Penicillium hordei]|uniref:Uncharacterized protein n=1 Tax=Penicillium hordei TaxID=40994 RepID=A0AAD6DS99_9EURO|nr:uncharacterized protein N7537_009156 [Penicillium hordei]KAJ5592252.1 hypothetical protein N7537_009156 [Penicillium hordei]